MHDPLKGHPLRSIVSCRSAVTYGVVKEEAIILRLLLGHSPHHIRYTQRFVIQVISNGWCQWCQIMLRLLLGHSLYHIRYTQRFANQVKYIRLWKGECITSSDVKALFTSVPVDSAMSIIRHKLEQDPQLNFFDIYVNTTNHNTVGALP